MANLERLKRSQELQKSGLTGVGLIQAAKEEAAKSGQTLAQARESVTSKAIGGGFQPEQIEKFKSSGIQANQERVAQIKQEARPRERELSKGAEDSLKKQLAREREKTEKFRAESQEKQEKLQDVTTQVTEFGSSLKDFQAQNQQAFDFINSKVTGLGDLVSNISQDVPNIENVNLSSPSIQDAITQASTEASTEEEKKSRIQSILENAAQEAMQEAQPVQPTAQPQPAQYQTPQGVIEERESPLSLKQAEKSETTTFASEKGMDFTSLVKSLEGTDGSAFTSADLTLQKLQLSQSVSESTKQRIEQQTKEKKERILSQKKQYDAYFNQKRQDYTSFQSSLRDTQLRKIELQEQKITAQKGDKKAELDKKTERYESFVKAQMAAAGVPLAGQAGVTHLLNKVSNWGSYVEQTLGQYDDQLSDLHNQSIDVLDNFSRNVMELNFQIDDKEMAIDQSLRDKWETAEESQNMSEMQVELSQAQALGDYFTERAAQRQSKEEQIFQAQQQAEKDLWEKQKWYSEQTGMLYGVDENGQPSPMVDENGEPILSYNASKFGMEFGLKQQEFDLSQQKLGLSQQKYSLEEQKYWNSLKEMDVGWNADLGVYTGTRKDGTVVNLGAKGIAVPSKSIYQFNVGPNTIAIDVPVDVPPPNGRSQCGEFANDILFGGGGRGGFGDSIEDDIARLGNSQLPVPGGAFMARTWDGEDLGGPGHKGVVEGVTSNGYTIIHSNYKKNENGEGIVQRDFVPFGSQLDQELRNNGAFYDPNPEAPKGKDSGIYNSFLQQAKEEGMNNKDAAEFAKKQFTASYGDLTDSESSSYLAYSAAKPTIDELNNLWDKYEADQPAFADKLGVISSSIFGRKQLTQNVINKATKDPDVRAAIQMEKAWIAAVLRKESGAAIAINEYKDKGDIFFPRPGDDVVAIERKKKLRREQTKALYVSMGASGQRQYMEGIQEEFDYSFADDSTTTLSFEDQII